MSEAGRRHIVLCISSNSFCATIEQSFVNLASGIANHNFRSAAGVLSLLDESDPQLQIQALEILSGIVDEFWAEISDYVDQMYVCYCLAGDFSIDEPSSNEAFSAHVEIFDVVNVPCRKSLCDNKGFPQRELAALILSKVWLGQQAPLPVRILQAILLVMQEHKQMRGLSHYLSIHRYRGVFCLAAVVRD
jgi:hypothetical protein